MKIYEYRHDLRHCWKKPAQIAGWAGTARAQIVAALEFDFLEFRSSSWPNKKIKTFRTEKIWGIHLQIIFSFETGLIVELLES
jgi:hypothetical protein